MSPYGISPEQGGDSKENEDWMTSCVSKVMKQGKDKSTAIAICKSTLKKAKDNKSKAENMIIFLLDKDQFNRSKLE